MVLASPIIPSISLAWEDLDGLGPPVGLDTIYLQGLSEAIPGILWWELAASKDRVRCSWYGQAVQPPSSKTQTIICKTIIPILYVPLLQLWPAPSS